ncbi:NifB/NifX family molybdenum-iron cluster-binding protein [Sulfurimonas sp. HSL3-7]|uniref:NifB/NifX family molybdenum-iron cluster-binding protein n=1 Tax=Sulfonitrofixus jiaomeiensis TaxID=3131938 RepID=UPI0031F90B39
MNIAFASSTGDAVDQHFGWSKNFYLYKVDKEKATLLDVIDATTDIEDEHEKLSYKIGVLEEADIMYCTQIGPKASKMVQAAGIHPVRVAEGEKMENAIGQLHSMLAENPPMWLLRIFHKAEARSA